MFENVPFLVWLIAGFFIFMFGLFIFVAVIAMFEKRLIKPYTENVDPTLPDSKQSQRFCKMFEKNGFVLHDVIKDNRGGTYKVLYKFYRSENGDAIAIVSNGSLMKIPLEITLLATRFKDGTWIKTINHQNGSEHDLTGLVSEAVYEKLSAQEFLDKHDDRIERELKTKELLPYDEEQPMIDYCGDLMRRADILVSRGLARFRNEEKTAWSYSFIGAIRVSARMLLNANRRNIVKDR